MIRLGLVGCGSVAQQYHLPALADVPGLSLAGLADSNPATLHQVGARWAAPQAVADYRELRDLDAVLVASPHDLHAPMCAHFLELGIHVLVEKPLSIRSEDAERLVALATKRRAVFAVGVFRRYYPTSLLVQSLIHQDWQGGVAEIDAEEGSPYDWELQSRYLLDRHLAGGGVLIDTGSHMLDRLLWWFPGAVVHLDDYADNAKGGVETDAEIRLRFEWRGRQISCRVELSRIRTLRNTIRLRMRSGEIEAGSNVPNGFYWDADGISPQSDPRKRLWVQAGLPNDIATAPHEYFRLQLADFAEAIEGGSLPLNDAASNLPTVRLIESCYARRRPLSEPWNHPLAEEGCHR